MAIYEGTEGHDKLRGTDVADEFYALGGNDSIGGSGGDDVIYAGDGNDKAHGGLGNDEIYGEAGDDYLTGARGDDLIDGGDGNDMLYSGLGRDHLLGGNGDDLLRANSPDGLADALDGGEGNDILEFGLCKGGGPYIGHGGAGDDSLRFVLGNGQFQFFGEEGDDSIALYSATDGVADGGDGRDFITQIYLPSSDFPAGSVIDLRPLWAEGEVTLGSLTLRNFEQIGDIDCGSFFDDVAQTVIVGNMPGAGQPDTLRLFLGGGDDRAYAGSANEYLFGDDGSDMIFARSGDDLVDGGRDDDRLYGGDGNDRIYGDAGNDRIIGGAGIDLLVGSSLYNPTNDGDDLFIFRDGDTGATLDTADTVRKFFDGDRISLKSIDADTTTSADDAFTFIGDAGFSGIAGELRYAAGLLEGDTNGDGVADLMIKIVGSHGLVAADFLL